MRQTQGDQAINRLDRVDGVAAGNRDARRLTHAVAACQYPANGGGAQHIDRHAHQSQRQDGFAAHGVDIRDGVGGGDAAKVERVVDDGHEEIGGGNQRLLVIQLVNRRVIGGVNAHHELWRHGKAGHGGQDVAQHAGRDLATTAPTVRQRSESRFLLWCGSHAGNLPCSLWCGSL